MKHGFTLVELSIVLVIIGLLIGGILVGQSLIESAKISTVVRAMQQYDIAVSSFRSKYRNLPGDSSLFTQQGNNNGRINYTCNTAWGSSIWDEAVNFWVHIQQGGFVPANGSTFTMTTSGAGLVSSGTNINVPALEFSEKAQIIAMPYNCPYYTNPKQYQTTVLTDNHFLISNKLQTFVIGGTALGSVVNPIFTPAEAASIDSKMDDGKPALGSVVGTLMDGTNPPVPGVTSCVKPNYNNINTDYDLTKTGAQCELSVLMLSQTGK